MKRLGLLYLIIQNIKSRAFRTSAIIICVGVAAGTLFSASLIMGASSNSLRIGMARLGADILVVPQGYEAPVQAALL